jgi:outer membrane lipoprotein SlyB
MIKFSKFVVTAFALALLVTTLSGCQKQEGPSEHAGNASTQANPPAQAKSSAQAKCAECGVIDSIREVTTKGEGSGLGVVGGAVVGGLLGNQVGAGSGKDVATVVGAVGGAVAGNQIEKSVKSTKSYDITVRFEDGSSCVIHEANASAWRPGDRVKVINGVIRSNS